MTIIDELNEELNDVFNTLGHVQKELAVFRYSDRPDLSDFQTNCALALCKELKKSPAEIAKNITELLKDSDKIESVSVDGPGFINIKVRKEFLLSGLNDIINDERCGLERNKNPKIVVLDFGGYNIAKELHVGHLRSTVIGESIRRIYTLAGDKVVADVHLGDWGLNMGYAIQGIKLKYPHLKCFQNGFNDDKIDDLNITATGLTECYRLANTKAKEEESFMELIRLTTKKLQDGFKPYRVLWQHFMSVSIDDLKELNCGVLDARFDLWNGESSAHEIIVQMIRNLMRTNQITISDGAKIIDLGEYDLPPLIIEKSDGAVMYTSSDVATALERAQKYNPDLIIYVVDYRQSLHFQQVFATCKKINILNNEKNKLVHCAFGTMNGRDGKPYKTRSGEVVKLRFLIEEAIEKIREKSPLKDPDVLKNIAVACIKFADLINYRESNYVFDLDQFTNYEGKTGAYLLYGVVRINSILNNQEKFDYKITEIRTKEEKDLLITFTKFSIVFDMAYNRLAPNVIAEYVFDLVKKFSVFYTKCPINSEGDLEYKKSKISLLYMTKKITELCLYLLGIRVLEKM